MVTSASTQSGQPSFGRLAPESGAGRKLAIARKRSAPPLGPVSGRSFSYVANVHSDPKRTSEVQAHMRPVVPTAAIGARKRTIIQLAAYVPRAFLSHFNYGGSLPLP